jgi:hypothetical protein
MSRGARTRPSTLVGAWVGNGLVTNLGDYESIATTTVGSGGSNGSVTFSSIPQTYKHLQVRALTRTDRAADDDASLIFLNSDTTKTNYTLHGLRGSGSAASSFGYASASATGIQQITLGNSTTAQMFGAMVIDILDYTNTNKNTTVRSLGGMDYNGAGFIELVSGVWLNTAAVNSISFQPLNGTEFLEYSSFALYGIRG